MSMCNNYDMEALKKGKNHISLDFSVSAHADCFLDSHGGEEFIKKHYKAVYYAFEKTREMHRSNGTDAIKKVVALAAMPSLKLFPPGNSEYDTAIDAGAVRANVRSNVGTMLNKQVPYIYVNGVLENIKGPKPYIYDTCSLEYEREYMRQLEDKPNYSTQLSYNGYFNEGDKIVSQSVINYVDSAGGGTIGSNSYTSLVHEFNGPSVSVDTFEVLKPRSKSGVNVRILYGFRIDGTEDYGYKDVHQINNKVKTFLPISGKIKFKEGYTPQKFSANQSDDITLRYNGVGVVYCKQPYSELAKKFIIDAATNTVNFTLPEDWLFDIDAKVYDHQLIAQLHCPFYYDVKFPNGIIRNVGFQIESEPSFDPYTYMVQGESKIIIPDIAIYWGCFGKDTYIQMAAGGSAKLISQIKHGDRVATYNGAPAEVLSITRGHEESMIHIDIDDTRGILLSGTHPILTARGMVLAKNVNITDKLVLSDGRQAPVRFIYDVDYNDEVYNLNLGTSPHNIIANGFVAGDFEQQHVSEEESKVIPPLSREVKELIEDMKKLNRELAETKMQR